MLARRVVFLAVSLLLISSAVTVAQVPDIAWSMTIPQILTNYPVGMKIAPNGNIMIAVNYKMGPNNGFRDSQVVAQFTPDGVPVWVTYPEVGEQQKNITKDIAVANNGNTWLVGELDIEVGWSYPFLMIIDPAGTVVFSQVYSSQDNPVLNRVLPLSGGGAVVAGTRLNNDGLRVAFTGRFAANGSPLWTNDYGDSPESIFTDVIEFNGGLLYSGGQNMEGQHYDPYFVHTDLDGNTIWTVTQNLDLFQNHGMIELESGGFVTLNSVLGLMWLHWYDDVGGLTSMLQLDVYHSDHKYNSTPFTQMPDGGFVICGDDGNANGALLRTDAAGQTIWEATYSNDDPTIEQLITDVILMQSGAIQFCGTKIDNNDTTWLVQLNPEDERGAKGWREMKPFLLNGFTAE